MIQSIVSGPPGRTGARRILLAVITLLAVFYGGYELGRTSAGYAIIHAALERFEARRRIDSLSAGNIELRRRVDAAVVEQQADARLQTEAQRMLGELQAETARQQQELQFYRGLVTRQYGTGTLRVQDLKIRHERGRHYHVQVTLVQAAARDTLASGTLTFAVSGTRGGALLQLALADLVADGRSEVPFSLRYFQEIGLTVELPAGFEPGSLLVEFRQGRSAEPVRQSFSWRVEGETGDSPAL